MFAPRYFAQTYFAPRYFPPALPSAVVAPGLSSGGVYGGLTRTASPMTSYRRIPRPIKEKVKKPKGLYDDRLERFEEKLRNYEERLSDIKGDLNRYNLLHKEEIKYRKELRDLTDLCDITDVMLVLMCKAKIRHDI